MDGLKELVEAFSARIKSPIIGSIILAFVALNWKSLFYMVFSGEPAEAKFLFFSTTTTISSLYVYPVIAGLVFALTLPWINFWGAKAIKFPISKHRNMQLDESHSLAKEKTRNAIELETLDTEYRSTRLKAAKDIEKLDAEYRNALLESAKLEQEIKDADIDEDVRAGLKEKISVDPAAPALDTGHPPIIVTEITPLAKDLIIQIGSNESGRYKVSNSDDNHRIILGQNDSKSIKNREQYLKILDAMTNLLTLGYVDGKEDAGRITKEGYEYINSIRNKGS